MATHQYNQKDNGLTLKCSKAAIDKSNPPGPTPPISITVTTADLPPKVTVIVFPQTGELFPRPSPYCEGLRAVTNLDPSLLSQLEWERDGKPLTRVPAHKQWWTNQYDRSLSLHMTLLPHSSRVSKPPGLNSFRTSFDLSTEIEGECVSMSEALHAR